MHIRLRALALCGSLVLLVTACSSPAPQSQQSAPQTTLVPQSTTIPDTAVGATAQRILDILQAEEDSTVDQWQSELDQAFLEQVSAQEVVDLVNTNLRPARPFTVTAYSGTETESVTTLAGTLGDPFDMTLSLGSDGKITGLLFGPADTSADDWQEPASLEEVQTRLEDLPGDVGILITRDDQPLIDVNSGESHPLASIFKLYVLLAVAEQVREGDLSWDDQLTTSESTRSLPSGELQDEPPGTRISVRDAAMKMISISDNTAADMLIGLVGRDRVEAAVASSGHHDPAIMRPFLTTREFFTLGWGDADYIAQWSDASDEDARRAVLEQIDAAPFTVTVDDVTTGKQSTDAPDWRASPADVAAVHLALDQLEDPEVSAILSENPGVSVDGWQYAAFKGGSSPGVLTGSWLLRGDTHQATVVILASSTDPAALDSQYQELFRLAQSAIRLVRQ